MIATQRKEGFLLGGSLDLPSFLRSEEEAKKEGRGRKERKKR